MRLPHAKFQFGFTLIELMVTLAVLAVLLAAAVPSFADFFDKYRLRGAADAVVSMVSNARAESVKSDQDVNVAFTGSGSAWCVGANAAGTPTGGNKAGVANACDCTNASACLVSGQRMAVEQDAFPDVKIGTLPAAMIFDSKLGTVTPLGSRTVTLTSPKGKYDVQIEVNALGQARACRPASKPVIAGIPTC
jgi:type IV fimbrial biogenesis protein FimT